MTDLVLDVIVSSLILANIFIFFSLIYFYRNVQRVLSSLENSHHEMLKIYIQMRKEILKKSCTDAARDDML